MRLIPEGWHRDHRDEYRGNANWQLAVERGLGVNPNPTPWQLAAEGGEPVELDDLCGRHVVGLTLRVRGLTRGCI